jgi:hypothetical protein
MALYPDQISDAFAAPQHLMGEPAAYAAGPPQADDPDEKPGFKMSNGRPPMEAADGSAK